MNSPSTSGSAQVSAYIRHRWDMELLRRTVDDAFTGFDLVVLPTQRIMPQKLSFVIDTEESTKPRSPGRMDLDNCTAFNVFRPPRYLDSMWLQPRWAPCWSADRGSAFL